MNRPTLEDLRAADAPAWLWDPIRLRAVWANEAALALFGCETLFDLLDRPFDRREPGVERLSEIAALLRHNEQRRERLSLPSTGSSAPLIAMCQPHALPDGRSGILVSVIAGGTVDPDLSEAFDAMPIAGVLVDRDGAVLRGNEAAAAMLADARRTTLAALLGDRRAAETFLLRTGEAGTMSLTRRAETRAGPRDLRFTARVAGENGHTVVLIEDVTDRRALEAALRTGAPAQQPAPLTQATSLTLEEEAAFKELGRKLADVAVVAPRSEGPAPAAIPDFIRASLDRLAGANAFVKDGALLHANPAALDLLGYETVADLARAKTGTALAAIDADVDCVDVADAKGAALSLAVATGTIPWLSGPALKLELHTIEPLPAAEPPAPIVASVEPSADGGWRAILDTVADGIVALDDGGRIKTFSAGAEAILGVRSAEVIDTPFNNLFAPASRKIVRDYLAALQGPGLGAVFNDGREVTAIEQRGGEVPLFLTIGRLDPAPGGPAFCAVVRDITQWKKTETELREARDRAEEASRQKSDFLARVSHELRTPLNAILGFSEVMRLERFGEVRNEKYKGYVNDIHTSGAHLLSLINDLLDLSKVEAGRLELNFTSVNLGEVIDHATKLVQEAAQRGRVILRKTVQPGLPNVVADLRSMRQIALNLLTNAIKFTDPGGQAIVSAQLARSGELSFRVKDTGIGMSADQLKDALEPYKRLTTEGRDTPGTGLGLPLTKALVEANRASFTIASEPRKGTMVEVVFPTTRVLAG